MDNNESEYKVAKFSFLVTELDDYHDINFINFQNLSSRLIKFIDSLFHYYYQKNYSTVSLFDSYKVEEELINLLHSEENLENNNFRCEPQVLKVFNERFLKLFEFSHNNNIYFNWCSFNVFKSTLNARYQEFEKTYVDTELLEFMKIEYRTVLTSYSYLSFDIHLNDVNKIIFQKSKNQKLEYLNTFFKDKNVEVKVLPNDLRLHEIYRIEFTDVKNLNNQMDDVAEDLSDSTAAEKIIYLEKLGVIDFLRKMQPFITSTNSLASILSGVTGEKSSTLQSMLNAMISKNVVEKNNPMKSKKTVTKIEGKLRGIGFKCD